MERTDHDIEKYLRGELNSAEMHALEKKALSDPFLRDALEGAQSVSAADFGADVRELRQRGIVRGKLVWFTPLRVAAGVGILISVSFFVLLRKAETPQKLAQAEQTSPPVPSKDNSAGSEADSAKNESTTTDQLLSLNQQQKPQSTEGEKRKTTDPVATQPATPETGPLAEKEEVKTESILSENTAGQATDEGAKVTEDLQEAPKVALEDDRKESLAESRSVARKKTASESRSFTLNNKTISGQVKSTDGHPLPGVNVLVKGTTQGTVSDINGNYSLTTTIDKPSLVFSFIGLQTSEVSPQDTTRVDVTLQEDYSQLSEVVVTGTSNRDDSQGPVIRLAEPFGGRKAYDKYLDDNLVYPVLALEKKVKGRVLIEFTVSTDGRIGDFNVLRSLGYGCDEEVIRLVKEGPKWFPSTENDVPVESLVRVRMKFDPAKAKK